MTVTLSKAQIEALRVELAQYGLDVRPKPKPRNSACEISARIAELRKMTFKAQSAFWKTAQIRNLTTRMKINAFHEANPNYWTQA
jgi:ABC-type uncharacterized transport system auxiliary subunit